MKSRALIHREFKEFVKDLETEYGDVVFDKNAKRMMCLFRSTYVCEQLFSTM